MNVSESFRTAIFNLMANKLRSFLTMLGIIIGIAAVVTMTGLGQGMRSQVVGEISSLGSNLLTVIPGRARQTPWGAFRARGSFNVLKYRYLEELQNMRLPGVRAITAELSTMKTVTYSRESTTVTIVGTTPEYLIIRNFAVQYGRSFGEYDLRYTRKVAVLGATVAKDLFQDPALAVGKTIRIGSTNFTVIGVLESKTSMGQDLGSQVFVPLSTHRQYLSGSSYLRNIVIQTVTQEDLTPVAQIVEDFFTRKIGDREQFDVLNQADILQTINTVTGSITLFLAAITGISLLVGGIGVMNIMLVSVVERTREIGLRKAIGAKPRDILFQFVIEAALLTLSGGVVGVVLGIIMGKIGARFSGWTFALSPGAVSLALAISLMVGLFFGIYPARRASKLDPIAALRYE
ncbi:MAG: ABC transporter permease [Candidatus Atribacteria bacterium]|nr:ABC transporter permease [Candidatus Atribacteria bacterium]